MIGASAGHGLDGYYSEVYKRFNNGNHLGFYGRATYTSTRVAEASGSNDEQPHFEVLACANLAQKTTVRLSSTPLGGTGPRHLGDSAAECVYTPR